jgi:hypothetical protein
MIDIVERLRDYDKCTVGPQEAATEIERLRAENEKLREALKPFAAIDTLFCDSDEMEFELWLLVKADGTIDRPTIKVGDLRAAAAAIRESGE